MFRLRLLGGFAFDGPSGATAPSLPQRRAEAVLAVLAVCGDLGCTRERLIALLWPESDEVRSRRSLRDVLHKVRGALGSGAVVSSGELLRLNAAVVASDVRVFGEAARSDRLADAVRAYGGPLLDGFHVDGAPEFERWLDLERTRLSRECVEALVRLAEQAEEAGDMATAAGWWARAVEQDPVNSHFVMRHMRALTALGDRGNAIKVADQHARRLRDELDLEPDREVQARSERIRRGETLTPPDRAASPGGPARGASDHEPPAAAARLAVPERRPGRALWAAGAAGVGAIALLGAALLKSSPITITVSEIAPVTHEPGLNYQPSISPDGRDVAFLGGPAGYSRLVIRSTTSIGGGGDRLLLDTALAITTGPLWSADGERIRFRGCYRPVTRCGWYETDAGGGVARPVTLPPGAWMPAWSPDGRRIAFAHGDTIFTAATGGGDVRRVAVHRDQFWGFTSLAWSPDGRLLAYMIGNPWWFTRPEIYFSSIWVVDARGGEPQAVAGMDHVNASPAWLDARHLLFVSNRDGPFNLYIAEVGARGPRGAPRAVPGVADPWLVSVAPGARRLAYTRFEGNMGIRAYDRGGAAPLSARAGRAVTVGRQDVRDFDLSPDGRWLAYSVRVRGNLDLYKAPLAGGEPVRLADYRGGAGEPRWSPDGREIVFRFARPPGTATLAIIPAAGGPVDTFPGAPTQQFFPAWSPDGRRIAFDSFQDTVWVASRDSVGGAWHQPVRIGERCTVKDWTPDGAAVLCVNSADQLTLLSLDGRVRWRRSLPASYGLQALFGGGFRFSHDGRTIYAVARHRDGRQGVWALPAGDDGEARLVIRDDGTGPVVTPPLRLVGSRIYTLVSDLQSDVWTAKLDW